MATSGTYNFQPSIAEVAVQSFRRIQLFPPALTIEHLSSARMALNLLLSDWAANRGVNLAQVDKITIPLTVDQATFVLPSNTIDLLDVYLRTYTANTDDAENIGSTLTAIGPPGNPIVAQNGEPLVIAPGAQVLSCTAGSAVITLAWPNHGLSEGDPIFWGCPISIGLLAISGFSIVETVVDANTLEFVAPTPALITETNQGGTTLFAVLSGSGTVTGILPNHGLAVGDSFDVSISTTVGGIVLDGTYTVASVLSSSQFTFAPGDSASSDASVFENDGQISVTSQATGTQYTDVPLYPFSRNDYAVLSVKATPGRPTSYWVNRIVPPEVTVYPVAQSGSYYGFIAYRMREIQDANPVGGQSLDLPRRMWAALTAQLTADLAEMWKPEAWAEKTQAALVAWDNAMRRDQERVTTHIVPALQSYFR